MVYAVLLILHTTAGITTLIVCLKSFIEVFTKSSKIYLYIKSIAILALFEIVSGIVLIFFKSGQENVLGACLKLGLYILFVVFTEAVLFYRLNQKRISSDIKLYN